MLKRFEAQELQKEHSTRQKQVLYAALAFGNFFLIIGMVVLMSALGTGRMLTILIPTLYGGLSTGAIFYLAYVQLFEKPSGSGQKKRTKKKPAAAGAASGAATARPKPAASGPSAGTSSAAADLVGRKSSSLTKPSAQPKGQPAAAPTQQPAAQQPAAVQPAAQKPAGARPQAVVSARPPSAPPPRPKQPPKPQLSREEQFSQFIASQPWVQLEKRKEDIELLIRSISARSGKLNGEVRRSSTTQQAYSLISRMAQALDYRRECIEYLMNQAMTSNYKFDMEAAFELVHGDLIVMGDQSSEPTTIRQDAWESTIQGLLQQLG